MGSGEWKICYWNVAGLKRKDREFMQRLGGWDVIVMMETWLDERGWERVSERLPKGYKWKVQNAKRKNKKGRAMGGMLMGIRKELIIRNGVGERWKGEKEGIIGEEVMVGSKRWKVVGVYVNGDMEEKIEGLREIIEGNKEEVKLIIGGDFNARMGEKGGKVWGEQGEEGGRKSRDKVMNGEGNKLSRCLEELGWHVLNGNIEGDVEGEYTHIGGKKGTVIEYVIVKDKVREEVKRIEVGKIQNRITSQ